MSTIDLALRYAIITLAFQLACAWAHTFQSPWPLADAFELAPTAKDQLFKSLGVCFDASIAGVYHGLAYLRFGYVLSDNSRDARPRSGMKANREVCSATMMAANATYTSSAPLRLTPRTSP